MKNIMGNGFGKMFQKIAPGMCRLSSNGIAISTADGYKSYNVDTGALVNCGDFVFDIGDDMFFAIPTNDIKREDIILANDGPAHVIEVKTNEIKAFSYKHGTLITMVPEHHVFLGNTYFYSKIVSMFGDMSNGVDMSKIMPLMMMSQMNSGDSEMGKMMSMAMMMNGGFDFGNIFSGIMPQMGVNTTNTDKESEEN